MNLTSRIEYYADPENYYVYWILENDIEIIYQDIIPFIEGVNRMYTYEEAEYWSNYQIQEMSIPNPPSPTASGTQSFNP